MEKEERRLTEKDRKRGERERETESGCRREKRIVQGKMEGEGGATVCNRGSRKREETSSIGAAKRGGKASEGARRREKERKRERRQ